MAKQICSEAQQLAQDACVKHSRRPKLVVITVGSCALGKTHPDGQKRLQLFAPNDRSWFSKSETGFVHGIDVHEVDMPEETSTSELLRELIKHRDADGIQLMRPLPEAINFDKAIAAISLAQDVDGLHFGRIGSSPPATVAGILKILESYDVCLKGSHAVVIGRSELLGQPLAKFLLAHGATVTLTHSETENLGSICSAADLIACCVGSPRILRPQWVKAGAVVLNVGTTFCNDDSMVPDIPPIEELQHAKLVVRSVGPISISMLLRNVAQNAVSRPVHQRGASHNTPPLTAAEIAKNIANIGDWSLVQIDDGAHFIKRDFHMPAYVDAIEFVSRVSHVAEVMNHHPHLSIQHKCTDGAVVTVEISTYALSALSKYDFDLAAEINQLVTT